MTCRTGLGVSGGHWKWYLTI